jgi:hypothetical protein
VCCGKSPPQLVNGGLAVRVLGGLVAQRRRTGKRVHKTFGINRMKEIVERVELKRGECIAV